MLLVLDLIKVITNNQWSDFGAVSTCLYTAEVGVHWGGTHLQCPACALVALMRGTTPEHPF